MQIVFLLQNNANLLFLNLKSEENYLFFTIRINFWNISWTHFFFWIYKILRAVVGLFFSNVFQSSIFNHGTIKWTGIICKKIPCYMRDSACRWFIVKKAKIFWSYVKHFWILAGVRNVEFWLVSANKFFWIAQPYFSTKIIKQS